MCHSSHTEILTQETGLEINKNDVYIFSEPECYNFPCQNEGILQLTMNALFFALQWHDEGASTLMDKPWDEAQQAVQEMILLNFSPFRTIC